MATSVSAGAGSTGSQSSSAGGVGGVGLSQVEFNSRIPSVNVPAPVPDRTYSSPSAFGMGTLGKMSSMSTINYNDLSGIDKSSSANEPIQSIERRLYGIFPGKVVTSNRNAEKANAMIITDSGVTITSSSMVSGISVTNMGVMVQGPVTFSASGTSIRKGEFTENPKSSNEYTYRETVDFSTVPDILKPVVKALAPDGVLEMVPIVTDSSLGPLPHSHTITMKHTHRLDPAYLSRFPLSIDIIKGAKSALGDFFSEKLTGSMGRSTAGTSKYGYVDQLSMSSI
jgi:hypothetical protein